MKAKNNDKVRQAIYRFVKYLIASVALAVCIFFGFLKTSAIEVNKILDKTVEYDLIQARQVELTEKMDTLYFYASLLNTDPTINHVLMQNTLSNRKLQFSNVVSDVSDRDFRLYKRLSQQMNVFLNIKDSIKVSISEEELVRTDLLRCISDNRNIKRRLSTGGITIER